VNRLPTPIIVTLAAIGAPELFGGLGLIMAAPLVMAGIGNSDDAKVERSKLVNEWNGMLDLKIKEKRKAWTEKEQARLDEIKSNIDTLDFNIKKLQYEEDQMYLRSKKEYDQRTEINSGAGWYDLKNMRKVPIYEPNQSITADVNRGGLKALQVGEYLRSIITGNKNQDIESRDMSTGNPAAGGATVPVSMFSGILDMARSLSVLGRAKGINFATMDTETVSVAKFTSSPVIATKAQNIAFDAGDISTAAANLKAITFGAVVVLSRELAADSLNFVSAIERALAEELARQMDYKFLFGDGTGTDPLGLINSVGIQNIDHAAGLDYPVLIDAWSKLAGVNAQPGTLIMSPRDRAILQKQSLGTAGYYARPELLQGVDMIHSSIIPVNLAVAENESVAIMGDFSAALLGIRQNAEISIDGGGDAFKKNQLLVRITFRGDFLALRPEFFTKISGTKVPS